MQGKSQVNFSNCSGILIKFVHFWSKFCMFSNSRVKITKDRCSSDACEVQTKLLRWHEYLKTFVLGRPVDMTKRVKFLKSSKFENMSKVFLFSAIYTSEYFSLIYLQTFFLSFSLFFHPSSLSK